MNKKYGRIAVFLVIILMTVGFVFAQGNLTPSGAPSAGMKTLEQIESRTPISSAGFVITNSGSYYITGNLSAINGQNGITVNADDVTIDLNGFTLSQDPEPTAVLVYIRVLLSVI